MARRRRIIAHPPGSIAERLNTLFNEVYPENRGPYTTVDVARLSELTDHSVSASYLQALLAGERANPTLDTLRTIAKVFDVHVSFFLTGEEREAAGDAALTERRLVTEVRLADKELQKALEEALALSPGSKRLVCALVHQLVDIETRHRPAEPELERSVS